MRTLLVMLVLTAAVGCGGDNKGVSKPDNPAPKIDLDAKAQKAAGDHAPGP